MLVGANTIVYLDTIPVDPCVMHACRYKQMPVDACIDASKCRGINIQEMHLYNKIQEMHL